MKKFFIAVQMLFLIWSVYFIQEHISPVVEDIGKILCLNGSAKKIVIEYLLPFFVSFGLYELIAHFFLFIINRCELLKWFFFKKEYLQGIWVGFYIGHLKRVRYTVEHIEQNIDGDIMIRGTAYDENFNVHSKWNSEAVTLDVKKGELMHAYFSYGLNDKMNSTGLALFSFKRKNQFTSPEVLEGYFIDSHIGERLYWYESKVPCCIKRLLLSEDNVKKVLDDDRKFLPRAKEIYEKNPGALQKNLNTTEKSDCINKTIIEISCSSSDGQMRMLKKIYAMILSKKRKWHRKNDK
jgi:hypothetical protein